MINFALAAMLAAILSFTACTAQAQGLQGWEPQAVGLNVVSANATPRLSPTSTGVYARLQNGTVLGSFANPLGKQSSYAGYSVGYGPFSLAAVGISGYNTSPGLTLMPSLAMPVNSSTALRLTWVPAPDGASALYLSVELLAHAQR
jgi:hypothetical protein